MRSTPLLALVCLLSWSQHTQASRTSSLVQIACARDPSLSFCNTDHLRARDDPILKNDQKTKVRAVREEDDARQEEREADLREKGHDSAEGFIMERRPTVLASEDTEEHRGVKQEKEDYCDKYEQHFSFYCTGDSNDGKQETVAKFCPSYKRACPEKAGRSVTSWPADPFVNKTRRVEAPVEKAEDSEEDDEPEVTEQDLYHAELKRRFPCKPDCDQRLFPHCTAECKCDYLYPAVQRFCNPPPMPLFLNTCRLWYNGCPKYEAYHYSSQFVYSKAEKGKVLPGQPQASNPNPYNIPTPAHRFRTEAARLQPIVRTRRSADPSLVIPPDLPSNFKEIRRRERREEEENREETIDALDLVQKKKPSSRKPKRVHRRKKQTAQVSTTPSPKEIFRGLRALNQLTKDPTRLTQDLLGHGAGEERPRALAPTSGFAVPSDAAYGDETFKKFDGLTDSRGILHRPRSTSPFTKPGLWEPNPADPHTRDPTNKYAYHVRSTMVDWLNGQMTWGAHWAVPAAGVGGTDGFSALHFPTIGSFLNIPDDYD